MKTTIVNKTIKSQQKEIYEAADSEIQNTILVKSYSL